MLNTLYYAPVDWQEHMTLTLAPVYRFIIVDEFII